MNNAKKYLPHPPYLQVALDTTSAEEAIRIASLIPESNNTIVEAGTPLIKAEGVKVIRLLSAASHGKPLLADMKTMDTGYLEAILAFDNGALITTVLGAADFNTWRGAVKASMEKGGLVQVDMINIDKPLETAIKSVEQGVHIIGLHAGIDQQGRGYRAIDMIPIIRELRRELGETYISIAGGIKKEDVIKLIDAGADIVVVGSAITKNRNPKEYVLGILETMGL